MKFIGYIQSLYFIWTLLSEDLFVKAWSYVLKEYCTDLTLTLL